MHVANIDSVRGSNDWAVTDDLMEKWERPFLSLRLEVIEALLILFSSAVKEADTLRGDG